MTRTRWLLLGVLAMVAVTAVVLSRRGPAGINVDTVGATRQSRFMSTVTASGQIVAMRYADIGSSVMGKIVSLPVAEGERVAQAQVLALAATVQGAREQVQAAMADVLASEARAADAEQQFGRKKELFGAGVLAAAEFEAARAADNARAQVAGHVRRLRVSNRRWRPQAVA